MFISQSRSSFGLMSLALAAALLCSGCAGVPKTTVKVDRISQPPPGKALINFHRPSGYGGARPYAIFNGNDKMLADLPGAALFQYVCDPGEQIFIGWADHVSVVKADVAPDKTYDILVDVTIGWVQANIYLSPLKKDSDRRARLPEFESREKLTLSINPASPRVAEYEASKRQHIAEIKADFLGGPKSDRVQTLAKDDCR